MSNDLDLDPPVCRLQFPDGSVPGNAREAAEGWKRWADKYRQELEDRYRASETPNRRNFQDELVCLLNRYSKENGSNTPDFILADYLIQQLEAWNLAVRNREEWYGRTFSPGSLKCAEFRTISP